jgi:hypothetical protein
MNKELIKDLIHHKNQYNPHVPDIDYIKQIKTDYDHFPYTRHWRGDYKSHKPVCIEREAGFRTKTTTPRGNINKVISFYPNHCFEYAPETRKHCYPRK